MRKVIQVNEKPSLLQSIPLSVQHLFAMFGASIAVPMIFGINPAIVLLMNGIGTLIFIILTDGKSPAFLGSSFAYIAPTLLVINSPGLGYQYALGGFVVSGLLFCIFALIIKFFGVKWLDIVLPPAALGPVVALIGLQLAGVAANWGGIVLDPANGYKAINPKFVIVFLVTLLVAMFGSVLFKKFFAVIPILVAIVSGYCVAALLGIVDYTTIQSAHWFALPQFITPKFSLSAIIVIAPASLCVISEHIGHQMVTSKIVGKDLIKDPGLHRSLLGDGVSTMLSGFLGSVPTTTYGENIGVMAVTRVYSTWVIGGAAVISIIISVIGKVSGAIMTMPKPVMGGFCFLLYGMIAASGLRLLVEAKVDYSKSRNLALSSVILITGLSGAYISIGSVQLTGMVLATIVAIILSTIFYVLDKLKLTNDRDDVEE